MLGPFITHCEDSLTASVFTHLLHLPAELFWQIIRNACYDREQFPESPGEPLAIDPWPKWDPAGTVNERYVEPDVFIRFREFDLIIEAKSGDDGGQYRDQWERELIAYTNEYGEDRQAVRMIALGGIPSTATDRVTRTWKSSDSGEMHDFVCPVVMCRWRSLLDQCKRMERELRVAKYRSAQAKAHHRIVLDLMGLFARRGFQTGVWFAELARELPRLSAQTVFHHSIFQQVRSHFSHP